ncbi:uncharacterized protein [Lolium perenne]|uniref:uncharacterized protein n=1 Tax=Lolium perenne TaxID=4522 RepID=UPI0021F6602C|nr:uncharacterized protein LOC127298581 [Lolium perenne]
MRSLTESLKAVDLGSSEEESDASEEEEDSVTSDTEEEEETPPAYDYPDDGECPPFVLIHQEAYFSQRHNATTATVTVTAVGSKLEGSTITVTFCPAAPPLVSYLCFHATGIDQTKFACNPQIIATENNGGLVLLRVIVGHPSSAVLTINGEYFIYDARAAKLDHLPHPGQQHEFNDYTVAMVRKCNKHCQRTTTTSPHDSGGFSLRPCHLAPHGHRHGHDHDQGPACQEHHHDCTYVIAAQPRHFGCPETSHLCIYHSDTNTWSKKPVVLLKSHPRNQTSKTLAIGGHKGTVAWVDLWQSIIFCNVLDEKPKLSCLKLPKPIMPKKAVGFGNPTCIRDIAVVGNFIKFVDMYAHFDGSSKTPSHWKAATWSIRAGSFSSEDWTRDHRINSTQIPPQPLLLHKLKVDAGIKAADPTFSTLHVGLPRLSLQDDDIVYFLAKIDYRRHAAWVLALDMGNMLVKEVVPFDAKRTLRLARCYDASRISAYLKPALDPNRILKRQGTLLLKSPSKKHTGDDAMLINL